MSRRVSLQRLLVTTLLIVLITDGTAFGWSEIGHRAVASLAYALLDPQTRAATADLLRQHPRFEEDFKMPEQIRVADRATQDEWIFQQAAFWPDVARRIPGSDTEGPRSEFHRGTWHYINQPLYLAEADRLAIADHLPANVSLDVPSDPALLREMNVGQALRHCQAIVADESRPAAERAVCLCWIFHLVGDIHQPMHSTALFSVNRFPEGDKGGNMIHTRPNDNLHAVWDRFPGGEGERGVGTWTDFMTARSMAFGLMAGPHDVPNGDVETWLTESRQIAETVAYAPEVLAFVRSLPPAPGFETPTLRLSEDYLAAGERASARRLHAAGVRLAGAVRHVFE